MCKIKASLLFKFVVFGILAGWIIFLGYLKGVSEREYIPLILNLDNDQQAMMYLY